MSQSKRCRAMKRQTGQYMTPAGLARDLVAGLSFDGCRRILEPSCGDGAFLAALADRLAAGGAARNGQIVELLGVELDPELAERSGRLLATKSRPFPDAWRGEVRRADFFREYLAGRVNGLTGVDQSGLQAESFDLIIGNPPFGGTLDPAIEDTLDRILGKRLGRKIKKETYAFFIVAALDLLRPGGQLVFVCSNTLLTIPTMAGLRQLIMEQGAVELSDIRQFSAETDYPMLTLNFRKGGRRGVVVHNSRPIAQQTIQATPHRSWGITEDLAKFFAGPLLGDYFVASSGMTTGKNRLFVRRVDPQQRIVEPYRFEFYEAPVTLDYELERARLGKISAQRRAMLQAAEARGDTERRVRVLPRESPVVIALPDGRYRPYNLANRQPVFSPPTHYIYWEKDGDAVLTYKKTGNWYLRGVGGQPYFGREGLTWPLIASRFIARYIPEGYALDSGAPCAFLREGVDREELFFALGWLLSPLANRILKTVINHTQNIQSKDLERMPYPWWVKADDRARIIAQVKDMIAQGQAGKVWAWEDAEMRRLGEFFEERCETFAPWPAKPDNYLSPAARLG